MSRTKVLLVGATGETGGSIINALLEAGHFDVAALVRPRSVLKPAAKRMQERGVEIRRCDLKGSEDSLTEALAGVEVVVSCVGPAEQHDQIPLAKAAKRVGVKRFVPCGFITIAPPGGIMWLRDEKEAVYNQVKQLKLGYTVIDVGWWYQLSFPRLESGKADYAMTSANDEIVGHGDTPVALTDLRDIGRYVAKIIVDDRTLNKMVFAYDTMTTQNQIYDLMEKVSGEKIARNYISEDAVYARVVAARQSSETYPFDPVKFIPRYLAEYQLSWGLRGDNNPEYAKYLGYVTSKELYPDFEPIDFQAYLDTVVDGTATGIYTDRIINRAHQRTFKRTDSTDSLYTRLFPRTESTERFFPRAESSDSLMSR